MFSTLTINPPALPSPATAKIEDGHTFPTWAAVSDAANVRRKKLGVPVSFYEIKAEDNHAVDLELADNSVPCSSCGDKPTRTVNILCDTCANLYLRLGRPVFGTLTNPEFYISLDFVEQDYLVPRSDDEIATLCGSVTTRLRPQKNPVPINKWRQIGSTHVVDQLLIHRFDSVGSLGHRNMTSLLANAIGISAFILPSVPPLGRGSYLAFLIGVRYLGKQNFFDADGTRYKLGTKEAKFIGTKVLHALRDYALLPRVGTEAELDMLDHVRRIFDRRAELQRRPG